MVVHDGLARVCVQPTAIGDLIATYYNNGDVVRLQYMCILRNTSSSLTGWVAVVGNYIASKSVHAIHVLVFCLL